MTSHFCSKGHRFSLSATFLTPSLPYLLYLLQLHGAHVTWEKTSKIRIFKRHSWARQLFPSIQLVLQVLEQSRDFGISLIIEGHTIQIRLICHIYFITADKNKPVSFQWHILLLVSQFYACRPGLTISVNIWGIGDWCGPLSPKPIWLWLIYCQHC